MVILPFSGEVARAKRVTEEAGGTMEVAPPSTTPFGRGPPPLAGEDFYSGFALIVRPVKRARKA
ncbi:hypothetical protein SAMN05518849_101216 [Sphingobium sp. AP50]|nr:hypothetical protein SAMN05518849_101216 [Sphingobium sp. AP50]